MRNGRLTAFWGITAGLMVAVLFNNCSPEHSGEGLSAMGSNFLSEVSFAPCSFKDEQELYAKTYHSFLMTNCSSCHVEGGQGKGAFASSNLTTAYNAFSVVGDQLVASYEKVSKFAVDQGHKPPSTGAQHTAAIDRLKTQWIAGLDNIQLCQSSSGTVTQPPPTDEMLRLKTRSKGINVPPRGSFSTVTWDLSKDILAKADGSLPSFPGVTLEVKVEQTVLGTQSVYIVYDPTLKAGSKDIKIRDIRVILNGRPFWDATTFSHVDNGVYAGTSQVLTPGSMVVNSAVSGLDVIAVSVGGLEEVVLPPAPVLPEVAFAQTSSSVSEPVDTGGLEPGTHQMEVRLNTASSRPVTVIVGLDSAYNSSLAASARAMDRKDPEFRIRPEGMNDAVPVDRWDWDFQVNSYTLVFEPGEVSKQFSIRIARDERDEANEQVRFGISSAVNAKLGSQASHTTTILDNDNPPLDPELPRFSTLMQKGGILEAQCFRCHNSVSNNGGYSLSDYELMRTKGVLVPGSASSWMFRRMNEKIDGFAPMPVDGLLSVDDRKKVELWITSGQARNN